MNKPLPNTLDLERYLALLESDRALITASKGLIRRRRSPMARMIEAGNVRAIAKAARERLFSATSREGREDFCRRMCKVRDSMEKLSSSDLRKEIIAALVQLFLVTNVNVPTGLIVAALWHVKGIIKKKLCPCNLTGDCIRAGGCKGKTA